MAGTFTQIHIHYVFVVKYRRKIIDPSWEKRLFEYTSGIIRNKGHKPLIVNGTQDHIHILLGLKPSSSVSDMAEYLKSNSSKFINKEFKIKCGFCWQPGYAAFSYSISQIPKIYDYIHNQKIHHNKRSLNEEYKNMLQLFQINYDEKYLFDEL